jgi:hypothetical protein
MPIASHFNLIGEYSMNDTFLVNHISITCDRIAELKLVVFSHICNVSECFLLWENSSFFEIV